MGIDDKYIKKDGPDIIPDWLHVPVKADGAGRLRGVESPIYIGDYPTAKIEEFAQLVAELLKSKGCGGSYTVAQIKAALVTHYEEDCATPVDPSP